MSLRFFHILFITLATLLCLWGGAWAWRTFAETDATGYLFGGILGFLAGISLPVYGYFFLRKTKNLIKPV